MENNFKVGDWVYAHDYHGQIVEIGDDYAMVEFNTGGGGGAYADHVTGTVTYVNEPHRYFTTEYESGGHTWKMSFKFNDIVGAGERGIVRKVR